MASILRNHHEMSYPRLPLVGAIRFDMVANQETKRVHYGATRMARSLDFGDQQIELAAD